MDRKYTNEAKSGKVKVAGWVHEVRDFGKIRFLILRDKMGIIQITAHKDKTDKKIFELMKKINKESVIEVEGKSFKVFQLKKKI